MIGERERDVPPIASIKNPAPIDSTIAVFGPSQSAAARIRPKIKSGVLGQILSIEKNEHCAVPKMSVAIENIIILFAVSSFMFIFGA